MHFLNYLAKIAVIKSTPEKSTIFVIQNKWLKHRKNIHFCSLPVDTPRPTLATMRSSLYSGFE